MERNAPVRIGDSGVRPEHNNGSARSKIASGPDLLDVFVARCAARATLYAAGELELQEAVDELQFAAVRDGLVRKLGQDRVQQIISDAFYPVREALGDFDIVPGSESPDFDEYEGLTGTFRAACIAADRKIAERRRNAPEPAPPPPHAAASTIAAAEYLIMQGDRERLRNWLAEHSAEERAAIRKHLEARQCPSRSEK